jgi:hypothetical protein
MSSAVSQHPVDAIAPQAMAPREVRIYSHSMIFYWWPVWVVGYLLALVTLIQGQHTDFGDTQVLVHPSRNLGVIFTFTFLLVILMTHFAVRGAASITVILTAIAVTLFLAYMGWWDKVLVTIGNLAIYMNLGFYVFFSTALFLIWAFEAFVMVRFDHYVVRPGQLVHYTFMGGGEETYDTRGMSVIKERSDIFRHYILGLGSGDLHVAATGARPANFVIHNVLFVGQKLEKIQQLVAMKPDDHPENVFTAGQPA